SDPGIRQTLLRQGEPDADHGSVRLLLRDDAVFECRQGRGFNGFGQGYGATEENQNQRYVRQRWLHSRRRSDGAQHVRDAGEETGGIEVPLGLLPGRQSNARRGSRRLATRSDMPDAQEVRQTSNAERRAAEEW